MSRPQPAIPVSAKMYRHFAVITVAITACLAMFADGENREAIAQHLAEKKVNHELEQAERELAKNGKGGNNRLYFKDNRKVKGSFASDAVVSPGISASGVFDDTSEDFAQVALAPNTYDGRPSQQSPRVTSSDSAAVPSSPPPGMTLEEFEELKKHARKRQPS